MVLGLTAATAQSDKMKAKATEKVEELNAQIVAAGDKSLALSDEQRNKIYELHIARLKELRKVKKADGSKEDRKAINKKYNQQIYKDILTKKQKKARKVGKEKTKE
ncbi:hypothetical protein BWZ20_07885 [Winogradskyella sp. J14-2]|nr:hypothetical protein BWZ20_07885 [Winogradskyella sp. J14-2]